MTDPTAGLQNLLAAFVPPPGTAARRLLDMRAAGLDPRTELFGADAAAPAAPLSPRRETVALRRFRAAADIVRQ